MAELKKISFALPKPIQSKHHPGVKLEHPKVSDMDELVKRRNTETKEWMLWAIDKELLVDEGGERLLVGEQNFSEFFHNDTSNLIREEFYSEHVNPFLESHKKFASRVKSLLGRWHVESPSPVTSHIQNFNERISQLQQTSPMLEVQTTLVEASSTLSAIHDEAQRSNRSNSKKWWIGFGALVFFTFFGINVQKLVEWSQLIWQWIQSILIQ